MHNWFLKSLRGFGSVVFVLVLIASAVPTAMAQEADLQIDPPKVDFYLGDGALTVEAPTGEDSQRATIYGVGPSTPALTWVPTWGGMNLDGTVTFATDMVATLWLEPEEAAVVNQVRAYLDSGGDEQVNGDVQIIGTGGESLFDGTRKVQIAIPTRGLTFEGDITLRIGAWGAGANAGPVNLFALYGSTEHPSRLSAGVTPESMDHLQEPAGFARTYYFDDESLTMEPPTSEESKTRSHDVLGVENFATSSGMEWGSFTVEEDMELAGDSTLTFWMTHSGDPALARTVRPEVHFGGTTVTQTAGISAWEFVDGETHRFDIALDTAGMELEAGTQVQVDLIIWSTNSDEVGTIDYLYGSTVHPAGLTLRAAGDSPGADPGLPELNLTSESTEANIAPGGNRNFTVQLENLGETNATVDFNASADDALTVSYPEGGNLTIAGNTTEQAGFNVQVSPDALINTTHTLELTAEVDGVPVGNLTFTIQIVRTEDADADDDVDGSGNDEGDADEGDEPLDGEEGFLPAPGFVPVLLLAFAALRLYRRRGSSR